MKTTLRALAIAVLCTAMAPVWAQNATSGQTQPVIPGLPAPSTPNQTAAPGAQGVPIIQPAPAQTAPVPSAACTYTIEQALEIAFKQNPDIKIAQDVINRSAWVVAEQRARFFPSFNTQASYTIQPPSLANFPGATQAITIQSAQMTVFSANILLPLDISSKLRFATDIAEYQFQIQYLNLVTVSQRLILDVKAAYYNLLRAQGQEDARQSAVNDSAARLKDTQARYAAGTVPKFDVTRAEVDLANLNQQLIQAQNQVSLAQSTLNRVMGMDVNSPVQAAKVDIPISQDPIDMCKQVEFAYAQRPEVKVAKTEIALNKKNVKLQQTGLLPSLNINTGATYNVETSALNSVNLNWQAMLVLSAPIWDGGVTRARVRQAQADVKNAADTVDQVKLNVAVEVRRSALNVQEAAKRALTTAQAVALAEESLRLSTVRYNAGIAVLVEVTDAQTALTDARFNYVNAQYDYAIALAELQRATSSQPEICKVQLINSKKVGS